MIPKLPGRLASAALRRGAQAVDRWMQRSSGASLQVHDSARVRSGAVSGATEGCTLTVGAQSLLEGGVVFERPQASVAIGERSFVNGRLIAAERIVVGDDVLMAWGVTVVDHDSHSLVFSQRAQDVVMWGRGEKDWTHVTIKPVTIGNKAWVGFDAVILKGITIGEGAVIAARSVVTKDVAPWTVVAGNPARVIRTLGPEER